MAKRDLSALAEAKSATERLKQEAASLGKRYGELTKERAAVRTAMQPAAACKANARRLVSEAHEKFIRSYGRHIVKELSGGLSYVEGTTREMQAHPVLPRWVALDGRLGFEDICGLFPALAVEALDRVIDEAKAPHGLADAERARRLSEIDAELQSIEEAHDELVAGAAEVGLEIAPIPAVAQRRQIEENRRRAEADAAAGVVVSIR